jgi:hypothetical protein
MFSICIWPREETKLKKKRKFESQRLEDIRVVLESGFDAQRATWWEQIKQKIGKKGKGIKSKTKNEKVKSRTRRNLL